MKRIILIFFMTIVSLCGWSQTQTYYIKVVPLLYSLLTNDLVAAIDSGCSEGWGVICKGDSTMKFQSEMQIINYLSERGWKMISMVDTRIDETFFSLAHNYFMTKESDSLENALSNVPIVRGEEGKKLIKREKKADRKRFREEADKRGDDVNSH